MILIIIVEPVFGCFLISFGSSDPHSRPALHSRIVVLLGSFMKLGYDGVLHFLVLVGTFSLQNVILKEFPELHDQHFCMRDIQTAVQWAEWLFKTGHGFTAEGRWISKFNVNVSYLEKNVFRVRVANGEHPPRHLTRAFYFGLPTNSHGTDADKCLNMAIPLLIVSLVELITNTTVLKS